MIVWLNAAGEPMHAQTLGAADTKDACMARVAAVMLEDPSKVDVNLKKGWTFVIFCPRMPGKAENVI